MQLLRQVETYLSSPVPRKAEFEMSPFLKSDRFVCVKLCISVYVCVHVHIPPRVYYMDICGFCVCMWVLVFICMCIVFLYVSMYVHMFVCLYVYI